MTDWYCPECKRTAQVADDRPHVRLHRCPQFAGLSTPMVRVGTSAKVYTREREDYVGGEKVFLDANGRPIMSVVTEYADGRNDVRVYAPTATVKADA